ncbi:hypothetical protein CEW46_24660 [Bacillus cereus]|nr:hypothetical protein CEW46_24660 [Bacillus cereus]
MEFTNDMIRAQVGKSQVQDIHIDHKELIIQFADGVILKVGQLDSGELVAKGYKMQLVPIERKPIILNDDQKKALAKADTTGISKEPLE